MKKGNEAEAKPSLKWTWRDETIERIKPGQFTAPELLDQKSLVEDTSDYLYYMTKYGCFFVSCFSIILCFFY